MFFFTFLPKQLGGKRVLSHALRQLWIQTKDSRIVGLDIWAQQKRTRHLDLCPLDLFQKLFFGFFVGQNKQKGDWSTLHRFYASGSTPGSTTSPHVGWEDSMNSSSLRDDMKKQRVALLPMLFGAKQQGRKKMDQSWSVSKNTTPAWRHVVLSPITLPFFGFILTHPDLSTNGLVAPAFQQSRENGRQREISNEKHASSNRDMVFYYCWEIDICQESSCQRTSLPAQTWSRRARMRPCWSLSFPIR